MRTCLTTLALLCALLPGLAHAQSNRTLEQQIQREAVGCSVVGFEAVHRGPLGQEGRTVVVARYTIEGCGGGNNWTATFGVFLAEGGRFRAIAVPDDPRSQQALPQVVERVRVEGERILVEGLNYSADDARCCPSIPRRATLALLEGRLVIAR